MSSRTETRLSKAGEGVRALENSLVCCFVLFNRYWGIVKVQGFPKRRAKEHVPTKWIANMPPCSVLPRRTWGGWITSLYPSPELRRWLHQSPPLPLQTDPQLPPLTTRGRALVAVCLGRSKVGSVWLIGATRRCHACANIILGHSSHCICYNPIALRDYNTRPQLKVKRQEIDRVQAYHQTLIMPLIC